eukprot:TRINITY_DN5558_c0_g2_i1.p1 TRINITY_DN5558_c0_g2~~TRINITY_DN5558_c0_g2_i1.p1  ORF type:complete len:267 (+),score=48.58 TRINITY_DN5558_c0_g2_i1:110-910(+)
MLNKLNGNIDTSSDDTIKSLSSTINELGIDKRVFQNMGSENIKAFVSIYSLYKSIQSQPTYTTTLRLYILPNLTNHEDLPKNYLTAIDNPLKVCLFILTTNPNLVTVFAGGDQVGGSLTRLNALPKVVKEGTVIAGFDSLVVYVVIDREGSVFGIVAKSGAAQPKSDQVSRGKLADESDAVSFATVDVKFDADFNIKPAKLNFTGLQPGTKYTIYYTIGLSLPGDRRVSPVISKLALSTLNKTITCLLYTSPSPRDRQKSRMPSSA